MKKVLVIDDAAELRRSVEKILNHSGFLPLLAPDGLSGVNVARSELPDVILCDVQMPNADGMTVYEHIRRQQPYVLVKFVFVSGDILNRRLQTMVDSSQVPLLSKPFSADKLDVVLEQVAQRSSQGQFSAH